MGSNAAAQAATSGFSNIFQYGLAGIVIAGLAIAFIVYWRTTRKDLNAKDIEILRLNGIIQQKDQARIDDAKEIIDNLQPAMAAQNSLTKATYDLLSKSVTSGGGK